MKKQTKRNLIGRRWKKPRGYPAAAWYETTLTMAHCDKQDREAYERKRRLSSDMPTPTTHPGSDMFDVAFRGSIDTMLNSTLI